MSTSGKVIVKGKLLKRVVVAEVMVLEPADFYACWKLLYLKQVDPYGNKLDPYGKPIIRSVKRYRCGNCAYCTLPDCGHCKECLNKKKYGGIGNRHRACVNKKCIKLLS